MSPYSTESQSLAQRFNYEAVPGFFVQSDPSSPRAPDPHPPAFGLKARTSPTYWKDFETRIAELQTSAPRGTRYVVCWIARHGQGWHNFGVDKFGDEEWVSRWSKATGDREIDRESDARLTPRGEAQAKEMSELWKAELARPGDPIPIPTKLFASPMARALATADITFRDVLPRDESSGNLVVRPLVLEDLRESLSPFTSEKRSSKTEIQKAYPAFQIEDSLTEEDERWSATASESDSRFNARIKATLDNIFGNLLDSTDTFVSITTHSGVAATILRIIGHRGYPLPTGGVIPVVIKATPQR